MRALPVIPSPFPKIDPRSARPLSHQQLSIVHALWDELSALPAADIDTAAVHLLTVLRQWLRADEAFWVGQGICRQDNAPLGRNRVVLHVSSPLSTRQIIRCLEHTEKSPDPVWERMTGEKGEFRVTHLRKQFHARDLGRSAAFAVWNKTTGLYDRLRLRFSFLEVESVFHFDRCRPRKAFSTQTIAAVAFALRGIRWFHRELLLSHGLLASRTLLTQAERRLLRELLSDQREKEIASKLALTPATTHQYAKNLYRKMGVNGRNGLVALWLNRGTPS